MQTNADVWALSAISSATRNLSISANSSPTHWPMKNSVTDSDHWPMTHWRRVDIFSLDIGELPSSARRHCVLRVVPCAAISTTWKWENHNLHKLFKRKFFIFKIKERRTVSDRRRRSNGITRDFHKAGATRADARQAVIILYTSFLFIYANGKSWIFMFLLVHRYIFQKKRKAMSAYLVFFFFRLHLNVKRCKSFDGIK